MAKSSTSFKPGAPGRPKGFPNKIPQALKDMILQALDESGGVEYLKARAKDQPVAFLSLVGKVLPMQIAGNEDGGGLVIQIVKLGDSE